MTPKDEILRMWMQAEAARKAKGELKHELDKLDEEVLIRKAKEKRTREIMENTSLIHRAERIANGEVKPWE